MQPDPLKTYQDGAVAKDSQRPVPLKDTRVSVSILGGGLALVGTERVFRNDEDRSIEATITIPVPSLAKVVGLRAMIDGRTVVGKAQRKERAREIYEEGLDHGRTAVLHEEVLPGVHMISVGHVPPGAEIAVTGVWAMPMQATSSGSFLRIPTTVGDIFGRSPLPDSDDLVHDRGVTHKGSLEVSAPGCAIRLAGGGMLDEAGRAEVILNAPIDILVTGVSWPCVLHGVSADGQDVTLTVAPEAEDEGPIDAAILADRSTSMLGAASGDQFSLASEGSGTSKHAVMTRGLAEAAASMRAGDRVDLWEYSDGVEKVTAMEGAGLAQAVRLLTPPSGGTMTGMALGRVLDDRRTSDILLVTDGKSNDPVDVHAAVHSGRRISVVLIGEDALDGSLGYLAAQTGGQLFVAAPGDAGEAVRLALTSMRWRHEEPEKIAGAAPTRLVARISGMRIEAVWGEAPKAIEVRPETVRDLPVPLSVPKLTVGNAVGAFAAALAVPRMEEDSAAALAEAHGLVTHLTSLVLVDEAGEAQEGIPEQRKVALMTPRTDTGVTYAAAAPMEAMMPSNLAARGRLGGGSSFGISGATPDLASAPPLVWPTPLAPPVGVPPVSGATPSLSAAKGRLDWLTGLDALTRGDLAGAGLPADLRAMIERAAAVDAVAQIAAAIGAAPSAVAVALLARAEAKENPGAARLARTVLRSADEAMVAKAMAALGL